MESIIKLGIIEDNDQTRTRLEHLTAITEIVGNAYPNKFERSQITKTKKDPTDDTISKLTIEETLKRIVNDDVLSELLTIIKDKNKTNEKPTPEQLAAANAELNHLKVRVSGRIATPPRVMGKAAFVHLSDGVKRLQIYVRKADVKAISNNDGALIDDTETGWKLFNLLDHGDFIGVNGYLFMTKTGELSIHVETLQFLSKALSPMPDKMHGIADAEIRRRQRYVDLIAGSLKVDAEQQPCEEKELTPREVFERRSKIIREMRSFLDAHGYIEVETPMLTPKATGAAARAFETHHNALDIDLYARIAPELYLKRLLVGGFERVYELNRNFRNEGIDATHNPEFTMLEFYCAYMDVNGMMDFCEAMIKQNVQKINSDLQVKYGETEIDFGKFDRISMKDAIAKYWKYQRLSSDDFERNWLDNINMLKRVYFFDWILDIVSKNQTLIAERGLTKEQHFERQKKAEIYFANEKKDEVWLITSYLDNEHLRERKVKDIGINDIEYSLFENVYCDFEGKNSQELEPILVERLFAHIEENLIQPTFITDFPKPISPLSKASPQNPQIAERFELFIAGMECANGFSELNDPQEQFERFADQMKERERGDEEAMVLDEDYIRALSYGMPPAAGIGIGIDRLVMLLTNRHSIRDVILFPHMRPERKTPDEA